MPKDQSRAALKRHLALAALSACLSGCALHWPWHHRAPSKPAPVQVVNIAASTAGGPVPPIAQSWDRNTLQLDLTAAGVEGAATLMPPSQGWPVRLEFRVQPGGLAKLTVSGAQDQTFIVPTQGVPLVLKLSSSVYEPTTAQITLQWSAADGSVR